MRPGPAHGLRPLVRRAVRSLPRPVWATIYPAIARFVAPSERYPGDEYGDRASAFAWIYEENRWHNGESKSGLGSTLAFTKRLRVDLEALFEGLNATSLLDAPCGDFNWMRHVQLPAGCAYMGRDIVPKLIEDLKRDFPDRDWAYST